MSKIRLPLALSGAIFFIFLSWDCTKLDTTTIGSDLIPVVDNVNTFDTFINVVANNIDSFPFGKECATIYPTDDHVLGYIGNDPYFGTTKATIYTELKPQIFPFAFQGKPADRTLDSVVLVLGYNRVYGDASMQQRVQVFQISKAFNPDSSSCTIYLTNPSPLGATTYTPARLTDSLKTTFRDTSKNQLRIRLSQAFLLSIFSSDTLRTDSAFKTLLNGFAIVPDNMGNALTYYSITDFKSKLAIYYKYKRTGLTDTSLVTYFGLFPGSKSANNIVRTRGASEISNFSNNNSNPAGDNFIYVQTTPGSYAQLKINGLTGLSNRIIHRAELVMDQFYSPSPLDTIFSPPPYIFLDFKDSSNGLYHPVPCDFLASNGQPDLPTYGGFRTAVKDAFGNNIVRYTFNISRYVQKVVTNKKIVPVFRLRAADNLIITKGYFDDCNIPIQPLFFPLNYIAMGRVKLVGGNLTSTAPNRIRLRIIYSKL